jgi:endonuclease/exonuclease/phosphatase family metal-dependent hydrolase
MHLIEAMAVALFFIQAVRVLFSVLFGVIYDALFEGPFTLAAVVINLLVVVAFLAPLCASRRTAGWGMAAAAVLVFLARIPLTYNDPQLRLYSSLIIVASAGLYAALLLQEAPYRFPWVWITALLLDQLLRAWGSTFDVTLRSWWLPFQVAASLLLCLGSGWASRSGRREATSSGVGLLGGLAIGAFLFLETSLLSLPNAIARWSVWSYAVVTPALLLATLLPIWLGRSSALRLPGNPRLWGILAPFVVCGGLVAGHFWKGFPAALALLVAQLVVLLSLFSVLRIPDRRQERVGLRLGLGFLCFLLFNFAYAFAFTYAYTLDLFRGTGLPVFLVAGLLATLPAALRGVRLPALPTWARRRWVTVAAVVQVVLIVVWAFSVAPQTKDAAPNVRIATYNIHYGYNTHWNLTLEEIAQTIELSGADIVALQEVDTGRITSYCVDDALWLARRLHMGVLYLPTVEHLTGIGLLYRFPLQGAEGKLLTSRLEQTGVLRARLRVGEKPLTAYGIWLGLEPDERAVQIREALEWVSPGTAVFGGDMNSTPDELVYARMREAGFDDPFIVGGFDPAPTDPAEEPNKRIDYVWIRGPVLGPASAGLVPTDARVLESLASDHRMVVVEARWE